MLEKVLDAQYRRPMGLIGRYIGRSMARDHHPENVWTVAVLQAQPADHILEVGFGPGCAIEELAKVVTRGYIAGVDFSPVMVAVARRRNRAAVKDGRVALRYGDAASLPFADNHFDKAFSIHSIYFWPQPVSVLRQVWRVLKPGGCLVLTVLPKERWNADKPDMAVGTADCRPYSGAELVQMLMEAGFSHSYITADTNPANHSNYTVIATK